MEHHPIFSRFTGFPDAAAQHTDWIGMRYNAEWWGHVQTPSMPSLDEEYFEWIDLLEAVAAARERYTMVELGAGFGRWGIRGALAAKQRGLAVDIRLVEGEPQHAAWAREAIELNRLSAEGRVFEGAIAYSGNSVPFLVSIEENKDYNATNWYGQCAVPVNAAFTPTGQKYLGYDVYKYAWGSVVYAQPITFESLTNDLDFIDFVDMDLQAAEQELMENAIAAFSAKVRMVHIGTHSVAIEAALREIFRAAGWQPRWDFSLQGEHETGYGTTCFADGVQSWVNPAFP